MVEVHLIDVPVMKQVLLEINECFGNSYHTFVVLPVFRSANGDNIDDLHMSFKFVSRIKGKSIDWLLCFLRFCKCSNLLVTELVKLTNFCKESKNFLWPVK